jgi:hypothetical protein
VTLHSLKRSSCAGAKLAAWALRVILGDMTSKLSLVFETVSALPERAQAEAAKLLINLRERHGTSITLAPEQDAFVQEGLDACDQGRTVDHDTLMRATIDTLRSCR